MDPPTLAIDINNASVEALCLVPGFGSAMAERVTVINDEIAGMRQRLDALEALGGRVSAVEREAQALQNDRSRRSKRRPANLPPRPDNSPTKPPSCSSERAYSRVSWTVCASSCWAWKPGKDASLVCITE
ncbi:MAG TPA: hypothetical protein VLH85_10305 [Levilinea sp.]|nr:hypothetical protein [Levilinea sp.]